LRITFFWENPEDATGPGPNTVSYNHSTVGGGKIQKQKTPLCYRARFDGVTNVLSVISI